MNAAEKAYNAKLDRQWLAAHGICQRCRTEAVESGYTLCLACRMDERERTRQYQKRRRGDETTRNALNQKLRERYEARKSAGLCVDCGKREAQSGRVRCTHCLAYMRRHKHKYDEAHKKRKAYWMCLKCENPALEGYKLCQKHYDAQLMYAARGRENIRPETKERRKKSMNALWVAAHG